MCSSDLEGDNKEMLDEILDGFSFEKYVPTPKELLETSRSGDASEFQNAISKNRNYAYTNWYDWRLANWGTKWDIDTNALRVERLSDAVVLLEFSTAWAPANEFWATFAEKFPALKISCKYFEEGMAFAGKQVFVEGDLEEDEYFELTSRDYRLAGAILDKEGHVDWDVEQDYDLWKVI